MSDKRLTAAIAKLDLDNDAEALTALRFATKLIKERGLDWTKVAEMITGRPLSYVMAPDGVQAATGMPGFGDIFADIFAGQPFSRYQARAEEPRQSHRPRTHVSGAQIPPHIYGTVRIDDEGQWQGRDTLVVTITSVDGLSSYGPLKVFDQRIVRDLREAAAPHEPRIVTVMVRQPSQPHHFPVINQASLDGHARAA